MSKHQSQQNNALQHRIFRADSKLSSKEINDLLGIKVVIEEQPAAVRRQTVIEQCNQILRIAVVTLVLAVIALLGSMYQLKIGPFYESEVFASTEF